MKMDRILIIHFFVGLCFVSYSSGAENHLGPDLRNRLEGVRDRALAWVHSQKKNSDGFGWETGDTTSRVIIATSTALENWPEKNNLTSRLIAKQLEVEILVKLLSSGEKITPGLVSLFSMGLNSICKNPHDFYGHNLIVSLEKHHSRKDTNNSPLYPETYGFALSSLAICIGGNTLHKRQVRHLLQIASDTRTHNIDPSGMAILALECSEVKRSSNTIRRHLLRSYEHIANQQNAADGSFGNIETTAMAIQVLASAQDKAVESKWNRKASAENLEALQEPNGSYHDSIQSTTEVIMAASSLLNGLGILKLRNSTKTRCSTPNKNNDNSPISTHKFPINTFRMSTPHGHHHHHHQPPPFIARSMGVDYLTESSTHHSQHLPGDLDLEGSVNDHLDHQIQTNSIVPRKNFDDVHNPNPENFNFSTSPLSNMNPSRQMINVTYWLWIGHDPPAAEKHNITLKVPLNTTFFAVMQMAAENDVDFEFSSTVWPNGHYIHTISGHREQPIGYNYWLLYRLPSNGSVPTEPNPNIPPPTTFVAPAGVDELQVQDGDVYLFWFKKL